MLLPNTDNAKKPAVWAWNPHWFFVLGCCLASLEDRDNANTGVAGRQEPG